MACVLDVEEQDMVQSTTKVRRLEWKWEKRWRVLSEIQYQSFDNFLFTKKISSCYTRGFPMMIIIMIIMMMIMDSMKDGWWWYLTSSVCLTDQSVQCKNESNPNIQRKKWPWYCNCWCSEFLFTNVSLREKVWSTNEHESEKATELQDKSRILIQETLHRQLLIQVLQILRLPAESRAFQLFLHLWKQNANFSLLKQRACNSNVQTIEQKF